MKLAFLFTLLLTIASGAKAQITQPDAKLVPHEILARFKPGTFLESIIIAPDGTLFIANHDDGEVWKRSLSGEQSVFAKVDGKLTGLVLDDNGTLHATGSGPDHKITLIYTFGVDGKTVTNFAVDGAVFLNGLTRLASGVFLVADSKAATIWRVEPKAKTARAWLKHEVLGPSAAEAKFPAANGIKLWGGSAYISNSDRAHVVRVGIDADGKPVGEPVVWADKVVVDDFAFDLWGNMYATTHVFNSVIRIGQDGSRVTIAGAEQSVVGSTALAFGRTDADRFDLYVVGDGGVFAPIDGRLQEAKLTKLKIGAPASSYDFTPGEVARPNLFAGRCFTAKGSGDIRKTVGPGYLTYLQQHYGRIVLGGQLFDEGQSDPSARLYFVTANTAGEARGLMEGSPYFTAGLYSKCEVNPFTIMLGQLIGGLTWPAIKN